MNIITDHISYIPFTHITREQVAELMNRSPGAIDYYVARGIKVAEGHIVRLQREKSGKFKTTNVIEFINQTNKP